jgi:hypothetical protein
MRIATMTMMSTLLIALLGLSPGCKKKAPQADPGGEPATKASGGGPVEEKSTKTGDGAELHTAAITEKGQTKEYAVKGAKGQLVELTLTNAPATTSPVDYALELVDAAGKRVQWLYDSNGADGTTKLETMAYLREEGAHKVRVTDYASDDVDPAGFKLTVRVLDDPDKNEPNNGLNLDTNKALATQLKSGESTLGTIEYRRDADWFKFSGKKNTVVELELSNAPATSSKVDYTLEMYSAAGTGRLWRLYDGNGADGTTVLKTRRYIPEDGTYYLRIFDWGDDEYETKGTFSITMSEIPEPDENEPNNGGNLDGNRALAKAIESGKPIEGMIEYQRDEDWFKISVDKGKLIQLELTNAPSASSLVDYTLELYNATEAGRMRRVYDGNGEDGTTVLKTTSYAPAKGDYFVRVSDWGDDDYEASGKYNLTLTLADDPDKNEPNNGGNFDANKAMAKPLARGSSVVGYIAFQRDGDWFVLDHKGGDLEVNLTNLPATTSTVDFALAVFDAANKRLASVQDSNGADGTSKLTLKQALPAGKYYLRVFDWGDDDYGLDQSYSVCFGGPAKPVN